MCVCCLMFVSCCQKSILVTGHRSRITPYVRTIHIVYFIPPRITHLLTTRRTTVARFLIFLKYNNIPVWVFFFFSKVFFTEHIIFSCFFSGFDAPARYFRFILLLRVRSFVVTFRNKITVICKIRAFPSPATLYCNNPADTFCRV